MEESLISSRNSEWAKIVFLSEEMSRNNAPPIENTIKTEEIRPKTPHIINHILNNANTWYEIPLPENIKAWKLKTRGIHELLYSFSQSHSTYMTLQKNMVIDSDTSPLLENPPVIYVMSTDINVIVEIEIWEK